VIPGRVLLLDILCYMTFPGFGTMRRSNRSTDDVRGGPSQLNKWWNVSPNAVLLEREVLCMDRNAKVVTSHCPISICKQY
jgi:hypothetical protein